MPAPCVSWRTGGGSLELGANLCVYLASRESDGITGKLISAPWDPWKGLHEHREELAASDIYTLRRIIPEDRRKNWSQSALTRFGLIGAGGVGKKTCRLPASGGSWSPSATLTGAHAESLVGRLGVTVALCRRAEDLIHDPGIDAVIISTLHDSLASLALQAIRAGKHVLVEKPAARHAAELVPLLAAEQERQVRVRIGYNHR